MSTILECKGLSHSYGQKKALDDISFTLESGRITGIFGPNGSGKTTLIKMLAGMIHDDKNAVTICGYPVGAGTRAVVSYSPDRVMYKADKQISDIMDSYEIMFDDFDKNAARQFLDEFGLDEKQHVGELSKGSAAKLQIILTMSRKASLYLLDEPFSGIDPVAAESIIRIMLKSIPDDSSLILTTHQISQVEQIIDEAMFIKDGRLILHEPVEDMRDKNGKSLTDAYLEEFR
ncbi:MAG: ABC transporter ATP-binding protein [Lachnospiraceae bacterium]|nr:ABC transporter ATP-binding protein [Lachnospiraceae bacterium]